MTTELSLISNTIDIFTSFNEVVEIYQSESKPDFVEFFVLLNSDKYNKKLMRNLINIERTISRIWDGKLVEVHYAPAKHIDQNQLKRFRKIF